MRCIAALTACADGPVIALHPPEKCALSSRELCVFLHPTALQLLPGSTDCVTCGVQVGDTLQLRGFDGEFTPQSGDRPVLMLAGGIGARRMSNLTMT